jgi:hypothetical protein
LRYLIWAYLGPEPTPMVGDVAPELQAFLREQALPALEPLSPEQYCEGPLAVLNTMARASYVLTDDAVLWCIEWEPGLVVLRVARDGEMSWAAMRSPVPHFAGREPTPEDLAADWHEDDPDSCYSLVFDAWDAQFEEVEREDRGFVEATPEDVAFFEAAMETPNEAGRVHLETMEGDDAALEAWRDHCVANLEQWLGEGIRIPAAR